MLKKHLKAPLSTIAINTTVFITGGILGNATDNVGLWIALGLCFGAGLGSQLKRRS
jgi:hypothetical protein